MLRRIDLTKALTIFTCLMMLAVIWLYPVMVSAQEGAAAPDNNAAQEIMLLVVKIVFSVLAILANFLVALAISYFKKKTGIEISGSAEALLNEWVDKGIGLAFEKSHQAIKEHGAKLSGPEKMEIALKFVVGMAKEYGVPELAEDKLKDYIEGKLGLKRKDEGVTLEEAEVSNIPPDPEPVAVPG